MATGYEVLLLKIGDVSCANGGVGGRGEGFMVARWLGVRAIEIKVDSVEDVNGIKNIKHGNHIGRALMKRLEPILR